MPDKFFWRVREGAMRPGFDGVTMARDNSHTYPEDPANPTFEGTPVPLGFTVNYYGAAYSSIWISDNGLVRFVLPVGEFLGDPLIDMDRPSISPFYADTDTRLPLIPGQPASNQIRLSTFDADAVNGRKAFGVTYRDVGYFEQHADKTNSFQVIFIDRSDTGTGNFDLEFNYDKIQWDSADNQNGQYNGLSDTWGTIPQAGFSNGDGAHKTSSYLVEVEQGRNAFRDTNLDGSRNTARGLIYQKLNSDFPGRLLFHFRNGKPLGADFNVSVPAYSLVATSPSQVQLEATATGGYSDLEYEWVDKTSFQAQLPGLVFSPSRFVPNPTVTLLQPGDYDLELIARRTPGGRVKATYRTRTDLFHSGTLVVSTGKPEENSPTNPLDVGNMEVPYTMPLSGSASSNMGTISYRWELQEGPIDPITGMPGAAIFSDQNIAQPTATFTMFGLYRLLLTATTANGFSKYDVIYINYRDTTNDA